MQFRKLYLALVVGGLLALSFLVLMSSFRNKPSTTSPNTSVSTTTPEEITATPVVIGTPITISGEFVCLPHRDQSGPQTMECAFGLKTPEGMYYALRDSDPMYKNVSGIETGKTVTVTGIFESREDKIYPTEGVLVIQSIH